LFATQTADSRTWKKDQVATIYVKECHAEVAEFQADLMPDAPTKLPRLIVAGPQDLPGVRNRANLED